MPQDNPAYKRILLKLSGESLLGNLSHGIEFDAARTIAADIRDIHALGVQIAVMIGGGNIFRGNAGIKTGMDRVAADYMGMLATIMNGIALEEALDKERVDAVHVSAIEIKQVADPFIRKKVCRNLEEGRVVIFSAGIGSPYFTTDTAAALRALEIGAEVILKATKVDGVFSDDPLRNKAAKKFSSISYLEFIRMGLKVMDTTSISLCKDNNLPIIVFNLHKKGNLKNAVLGKKIGTIIN
ncbi:MAG: UMP kinase [Candidatus Aminicenantes bacterium]|nr:UMP kinase [Candidatus Aminicenantes bacterium]